MSEYAESVENTEGDVGSNERTLLLIKPDIASNANIVRDIVCRITQMGLQNTAVKVLIATRKQCMAHYAKDDAWCERQGQRKIDQGLAEAGLTALEVGRRILELMADYMTYDPMIAMIIEGEDAVKRIVELVGSTEPVSAAKGTLRNMYSNDSYASANGRGEALHNAVHCSESVAEAEREIPIWFQEEMALEIGVAFPELPEEG